MFSAADLIQALQRRMLLRSPRQRRPAGEFPAGWQTWFDTMRERAGAVTGAPSEQIVAEFLHRPLSTPPRRAGELTRWQAFATLWRQQWQPPEPEERKVRWIAGIVSALWHLFFSVLLIWLMYIRFMALGTPSTGENVVQVEYIGRGTPQQTGGVSSPVPAAPSSAPSKVAPSPATAPQLASPQTSVAPADIVPTLEAPPPDVAQRDVPEPPPAAEQPVLVSEPVPSEPTVFVLPPTRRRVEEPPLTAPELRVEPRQVQAVEVPEPLQARQRELPQRRVEAPELTARTPEVTAREIPVPLPRPVLPEVKVPPTSVPELQAPTPTVRTADIPSPRPPVAAASAVSPAPAGPPSSAPVAAPASTTPAPATATSTTAATTAPATGPSSAAAPVPARPTAPSGAGPQTAAPPGLPSPKRGDDWGASTRDRPGGPAGQEPGLYNPDGSVRMAETPGSASPGQPPGTITEEIKDLDRAGVWLKRKPTDYEPTAFDKYWRPSETLLQEWVRKSIKRVLIPIPGTSKRIVCDVTLLAFGGGCGIVDPNLNDQPAGARPPPDIPFKPALQEDNGSVRP
ncbi:transmembrane repetitive protein [Lysobacter niastensis]|uniref:Transmembrane repetitive protein n=1 Tax=Lysobacter niastensis TaxID=380629 RepID=A0ABS0B6V8_9GAMM|nr:transmembrane repetitive protein [Lysobacter niastensis]MBF6024763.1 transmembrane repetitive protein [Lysobacter niastensis]